MSFIIAVYVNEGIVMASDRRTTYTRTENINGQIVRNIGIHTTNSTDKTFICPNGAGISTCGDASLQNKPITGFIQDMIRTKITEATAVSEIPQIIIDYFGQFQENPRTSFIVAGYDDVEGKKQSRVYDVQLLSKNYDSYDTTLQGAVWNGEKNTIIRIIQSVGLKKPDGTYEDLVDEEILWQYFTLQDAVDFAKYAVETTSKTMRFKNVVETVGGSIDILVITPDKTEWLQKENLTVRD